MGWDCTLHLIDPKAISKTITLLVKGKPAPQALLEAYPEGGATLWAEAAKRVLIEDPETAAVIACQIAIYASAATLPHVAVRGRALSFAEGYASKGEGPWIPERLRASPEVMFKALLRKRPELKGAFHTVFEHNSDTGVFVPAKHVTEAAEQIRNEGYPEIYRALRAAKRHKLAYWEATDLGVAQTRPELLVAPFEQRTRVGPARGLLPLCLIHNERVFFRGLETVVVDPSAEPLAARPCPKGFYVRHAARLDDGRWLNVEDSRNLHLLADAKGLPGKRLKSIPFQSAGLGFTVHPHRGGALLLPTGEGSPLCFDLDGGLRPLRGLPPGRSQSRLGAQHWATAAARMSNGNLMLLWNAQAYELTPEALAKGEVSDAPWSFGLEIKKAARALYPWGEDGFYYGENHTLHRIRRGAPPERVARFKDLIVYIGEGPEVEGAPSILVAHERHPKKRTLRCSGCLVSTVSGRVRELDAGDMDYATQLRFASGALWGAERRGEPGFFRLDVSAIADIPLK